MPTIGLPLRICGRRLRILSSLPAAVLDRPRRLHLLRPLLQEQPLPAKAGPWKGSDMLTLNIDGVGKVRVDDTFLSLSPEDQAKTVDEIAAKLRAGPPTVERQDLGYEVKAQALADKLESSGGKRGAVSLAE